MLFFEVFWWSLTASWPPRSTSWSARPSGLSHSRPAPHCCSPVLFCPSLLRDRLARQGFCGVFLTTTSLPPTWVPGVSSICACLEGKRLSWSTSCSTSRRLSAAPTLPGKAMASSRSVTELRHAQALADIGFEQALAVGGGQAVGAFERDVLDREATAVGGRGRGLGLGFFAGQVLELVEAPALLVEQAVLAVADQVLIARRGGGRGAVQA